MYVLGFFVAWWGLRMRAKKPGSPIAPGQVEDLIFYIALGVFIGGRVGYMLFYNIGGFLALNDDALAEHARNLVVVYEGLHTYGGMAGRDMEAMARGIAESVEYDHVHARVGQVEYLGQRLIDAGVPVVTPIGGHGVFLNARAFLPHLQQKHFPGTP